MSASIFSRDSTGLLKVLRSLFLSSCAHWRSVSFSALALCSSPAQWQYNDIKGGVRHQARYQSHGSILSYSQTQCVRTFARDTWPLPQNYHRGHRVGMAGRCPNCDFWGTVSGKGQMSGHSGWFLEHCPQCHIWRPMSHECQRARHIKFFQLNKAIELNWAMYKYPRYC